MPLSLSLLSDFAFAFVFASDDFDFRYAFLRFTLIATLIRYAIAMIFFSPPISPLFAISISSSFFLFFFLRYFFSLYFLIDDFFLFLRHAFA